jgi:hypothetical protein
MISKLFNKIYLFLRKPKPEDVYYGNPSFFVISNPIELVLHGLTDIQGRQIHMPIPSDDCYKMTIYSDSMPDYYICESEVLCSRIENSELFIPDGWKKRTQVRRIDKDRFHQMILSKTLKRGKNV